LGAGMDAGTLARAEDVLSDDVVIEALEAGVA
jgi:hypothetical protein